MNAKKIVLGVVILLAVVGVVAATVIYGQSNVVKVTTTNVGREDLVAIVSGTGQIKPKTYVNIGATAFGRITKLNVQEGDHVKAGTVLATLENVQPSATVAAQAATIASTRTDVNSDVAAEQTAAANIQAAQADLEQKRLDYSRAQQLYNDKLIAKQDFDSKQAAFDTSKATLAQRQAALTQSKAVTDSQRAKVNQATAAQRSNFDALDKTIARAPFDGLVTNVPVREGETMVTGIQNAEGSTLMTLADMSVITAEVKVDETDIVNVSLNQSADVTVDCPAGPCFQGPCHRGRRPGAAAHDRRCDFAVNDRHRRSERLQSRGHHRQRAGRPAEERRAEARTFGHGQDYDGAAAERAFDSDPGTGAARCTDGRGVGGQSRAAAKGCGYAGEHGLGEEAGAGTGRLPAEG